MSAVVSSVVLESPRTVQRSRTEREERTRQRTKKRLERETLTRTFEIEEVVQTSFEVQYEREVRLVHAAVQRPLRVRTRLTRTPTVEELLEEAVELMVPQFERPFHIQLPDVTSTIEKYLIEEPTVQEIESEMIAVVQQKLRTFLTTKAQAYAQFYISRYKYGACQSRKFMLKMTPATMSAGAGTGTYMVRRFVQAQVARAPLIGRASFIDRRLYAALKKKSFGEILVTAFAGGVTPAVNANDTIAMFLNRFYNALRPTSLMSGVLRPHLTRFFFGKALGVPELWRQMHACSVYWEPRIGRLASAVFIDRTPNAYNFASRPHRKWKSVRDIYGQVI